MYQQIFLCFHAVTEKDPVVSIALLTVADSSGQQYSGACLINLACMPCPTVHGMRMQQLFSKKSSKITIYKN